jgi:hypothetical protein
MQPPRSQAGEGQIQREIERKPLSDDVNLCERSIGRQDAAAPADAVREEPLQSSEKGRPAVGKGVMAERRQRDPVDPDPLAVEDRFRQQYNVAAGQIDFPVVRTGIGNGPPQTPVAVIDVPHRQVEHDERRDPGRGHGRKKTAQPVELGRFPTQAVADEDGGDAVAAGQVAEQHAAVEAAADQHGYGVPPRHHQASS